MTAAPNDGDGDGALGLNLVFSAPSSSGSGSGSGIPGGVAKKKPKRRTKYDRRRERGRLAKLAKEREREERAKRPGRTNPRTTEDEDAAGGASSLAGVAAALGGSNRRDESTSSGGGPAVASAASAAAEEAGAVGSDEAASAKRKRPDGGGDGEFACVDDAKRSRRERTTRNNEDDASDDPDATRTAEDGPSRAEGPAASRPPPEPKEAPSPAASTAADDEVVASRRHRPQTSLTEEQRARYLSEFHARPRDLDRGEGAARDIKASRSSDHIFGGADDAVDEEDEGACRPERSDGETRPSDAAATEAAGGAASCPFGRLGLHPRLVSALTAPDSRFRLTQPTVVQSRSVAALLPGGGKRTKKGGKRNNARLERNLFIQSETGSGKTLAYLLPVLQHLAVDPATESLKRVDRHLGGTRAVLLCPTRELATQTHAVALNLCGAFPWIVPGCLSGGEKRKSEKARLRKGITVLVATPGRLLDHLSKTESLLAALKNKLEWFVLDEADRLLDAGLGGQVEQIVQHFRSNQPGAGPRRDGVTWRSVLVSATVSGELRGLAEKMLGGNGWAWARGHRGASGGRADERNDSSRNNEDRTPSSDQTGNHNELDNATPRQLAQLYMVVSAKMRLSSLVAFLSARAANGERTVVFLSTCDSVDYHHALFNAMECILGDGDDDKDDAEKGGDKKSSGIFGKGCPVYKLHGDVPHGQRRSTLASFNGSDSAVLLATDVAARGLNFPSLDWTVQYDPPCETKDYVHRAGRSARAGNAGHALLFLLPSERQYVEVLQLRGLKEISPLSLSATLGAAAKACGGVAREGEDKASGNKFSDARGEAFTTAVQNRLEQCVIQNDVDYKASIKKKSVGDPKQKRQRRRKTKDAVGPLLEGARRAYAAFVRAYPAKERAVRHVFNARALHLGHVARSLALREAPGTAARERGVGADGEAAGRSGGRGERPKSRLAFGNEGVALEEERDSVGDSTAKAIEDGELERDLSLLGDAIGASGRRAPVSKRVKPKPSGGEGNIQKRMMEAAMRMQAQEFM